MKDDEPFGEPEDEECQCEGIEPEWEWDKEEGVWKCQGCGAVS